MSSRCDRRNWVSTMNPIASSCTFPSMRIAQAKPIPSIDRADFTGRRATFRAIIRPGCDRIRRSPSRSGSVTRNRSGGSGRIASAGSHPLAFRTAWSAPSTAEATLTSAAIAATAERSSYWSHGNR